MRSHPILTAASAAALAVAPALAGPDWTEIPDAPKLQPGQVIPFSPIQSISGELVGTDALGGPDIADLFQITIGGVNPVKATTATSPLRQNGTNFDTVLWLFDTDGFGLLAHDDIAPGDTASEFIIPGPGVYLLAISRKGTFPISSAGPIFDFTDPASQFQVIGPEGPGGGQPLINWIGEPADTPLKYTIRLEEIPAPGPVGLLALAGVALASARSRPRALRPVSH